MADPQRYFFEGELRTLREIHDLIPAIGKSTLREWGKKGVMPETKLDALTRPKRPKTRLTAEQKTLLSGLPSTKGRKK